MVSSYILTYFNFTGRAEPARIMFNVAGVEFTDNQFTFGLDPFGGKEWSEAKPNEDLFPLGQLPTLQIINGEKKEIVCQSLAVFRYIANEFNLYGDTSMDKAVIDSAVDVTKDLFEQTNKISFGPNVEKNVKEFFESARTIKYLRFVEKKLKEYNPAGAFFLGDKISMIDCIFYTILEYWFHQYPSLKEQYPAFQLMYDGVRSNEGVKAYLDGRQHGLGYDMISNLKK